MTNEQLEKWINEIHRESIIKDLPVNRIVTLWEREVMLQKMLTKRELSVYREKLC